MCNKEGPPVYRDAVQVSVRVQSQDAGPGCRARMQSQGAEPGCRARVQTVGAESGARSEKRLIR
jgi:hypothetical protein